MPIYRKLLLLTAS